MLIRPRLTMLIPQRAASGSANHPLVRDGFPLFPGGALPRPDSTRRLLLIRGMALIALAMTFVYLGWRTFFTVALDVWWVSIPLLALEAHAAVSLILFIFSLWDRDAAPPARVVTATSDRIAVLIPTYNEPIEILLPTVAAALALEPAHETWVLDDGRRENVRQLAESLGAHYLTRPTNEHAKAGNLNHALGIIEADFIAVLDADHVATPNFLRHTLGYFDDPDIALVQTPQDFYNMHSFEHGALRPEMSDEHVHLYHEQALFYRVIQPAKNRWHAAFWCGTNAVVRVAALRSIGGIATDTITEDIHTTIRLHRRGWKTVYHNEVLARGLAASSADQYQLQRYRWGTGAMQVLRKENPIWVRGLSLPQRLGYAKTLLGWFDAWRILGYLLVPPVVLFTGAVPIDAEAMTFLLLFLTTFLLQRAALRLLSRGYFSEQLQTVFELVRMTPTIMATLSLFRRRGARFQVTPKGRVSTERRDIAAPRLLYWLLGLNVVASAWFVLTWLGLTPTSYEVPWAANGAAFWVAVNMWFLVSAVRRVKAPAFRAERRSSVRFDTTLVGELDGAACEIRDLSLTGARVIAPSDTQPGERGSLVVAPGWLNLRFDVTVRMRRVGASGQAVYGLEFVGEQFASRAHVARALFNATIPSWSDAPQMIAAD